MAEWTDPSLEEHLRDYLVAQQLARLPRTPAPAAAATALERVPAWIDPRDGVPAPGKGRNQVNRGRDVVLGIFRATGVASAPYQGFIRNHHVNLRIRGREGWMGPAYHEMLYQVLNDRRHWLMAALVVEQSYMVRDLQSMGSDGEGWVWVAEYQLQVWDQAAV